MLISDERPPRPPRPRQCGRCQLIFPGDPDLFVGVTGDWWLCATCRPILLHSAPTAAQP